MNKLAWLIERDSPAKWWRYGSHDFANSEVSENWTSDAAIALHFETKEGAESEIAKIKGWGVAGNLVATEHMFGCGASPSAESKPRL